MKISRPRFVRRPLKAFEGNVIAIPGRTLALVFGLLLFLLPLLTRDPYILRIAAYTNLFVIFAVSWDFLSGYVGQISLGHAAFFGISAYTAALLNTRFDLEPWATIPLGALGGVAAGLIIAIPSLRLRGPYFALATLAFPVILSGLIWVFPDITGGEMGISGLTRLSSSRVVDHYVILVVMAVSVLVMWKLTDARSGAIRTGVLFRAIHEDEIAARAIGINTIRYKILGFAISGFFAGIVGGFYAHLMRVVGPSTLDLFISIQPVIWTVFGGIGSIYGPATGVYILYPLLEVLRVVPEYRMLIFALLAVVILTFMPEGIAVWIRDKLEQGCPRCKLTNVFWRRTCRACGTDLYLERGY